MAELVYHDCVISINNKDTMADLVELDMIDFDVIFRYGLASFFVCTNKL